MQSAVRRVRVDDPSAIVDATFAHALAVLATSLSIAAVTLPWLHHALLGSLAVAAVTLGRLALHPLCLARLHRVYLDDAGRVLVATAFGRARAVVPVFVEHDAHAAWPCSILLDDGTCARFVARRDDGVPAFLLLALSDRARYEGEREARDSLVDLEICAASRSAGA
jgi:hypothetical protein